MGYSYYRFANSTTCISCDNGTITADVSDEIGAIQYFISPFIGANNGNIFLLLPPGIYEICINDSNQCIVCKTNTIFEDPTGLNENNECGFSIFPNPAHSEISIHSKNLFDNKFCSLEDIQGRKLIYGQLENGNTQIDLTKLSPGVYFIRIYGNERRVLKFIKE